VSRFWCLAVYFTMTRPSASSQPRMSSVVMGSSSILVLAATSAAVPSKPNWPPEAPPPVTQQIVCVAVLVLAAARLDTDDREDIAGRHEACLALVPGLGSQQLQFVDIGAHKIHLLSGFGRRTLRRIARTRLRPTT